MNKKYILLVPLLFIALGAGCKNPFSAESEETLPVTEQPTTSSSGETTAPVVKPGTKTFSDEVNKYEVTAPDAFTFEPKKITTDIVGLKSLEGGVSFLYPQSFFVRSVGEAKIILAVEENKKCVAAKEKTVIKGITFHHTTVADAGAGNQYRTEDYATEKDGKCYHVALFLHTTTPENYASNDAEAKSFRSEHEAAVKKIEDAFHNILNTFTFLP